MQAYSCSLEALRIQPTFAIAWSNLAGIFMESGDLNRALQYYKVSYLCLWWSLFFALRICHLCAVFSPSFMLINCKRQSCINLSIMSFFFFIIIIFKSFMMQFACSNCCLMGIDAFFWEISGGCKAQTLISRCLSEPWECL